MKKALVISNLALLCVGLLLGFLLLDARTQLQLAVTQNTAAPITLPSPALTPAPDSDKIPIDNLDNALLFIKPYGTLPAQRVCVVGRPSSSLPALSLEDDNPIDEFFDEYWPRIYTTMEENAMAGDYRDCWKAEMLHAYDLLAGRANPSVEYLRKEIEETKDAMLEFTQKDSELFATVLNTDAYGSEGGDYEDTVLVGSGWPGIALMAQAAHYRAYTFYLYDLLSAFNVKPDLIFTADAMEKSWEYLFE